MDRQFYRVLGIAISAAILAGCGVAQVDEELADRGEKAFRVCAACHALRPGQILVGPSLAGIFGRKAGSERGFPYSTALAESDLRWDEDSLSIYIANPNSLVPGTNMVAPGVTHSDATAIVEFLKTQ